MSFRFFTNRQTAVLLVHNAEQDKILKIIGISKLFMIWLAGKLK